MDEHRTTGDNPGVIVRPPLLYLGTLLVAAMIDWASPASFRGIGPPLAVLQGAGGILAVLGAVVMALAIRRFAQAGTNVPTNMPSTALVTEGIYAMSRNPIYVGMSCIYAGLSLLFDNPYALGLLLPVLMVMHFGVILREERYLDRAHGQSYGAYRQKVRRWL